MSTPGPSPQPPAPRLGIFGGSFDPVHYGHLELARACHEQAQLDEVWFTPTAIQPLKHGGPQASDVHRVEMLRLAIENLDSGPGRHGSTDIAEIRPRPNWRICTLEIDRGGYSYTVDTLRQIHEELPETELFFLMGADALRDVPNWKEPAEIFRLANPLVVARAGESAPDLSAIVPLCPVGNPPQTIAMPPINVSSSEIRQRIAAGESIDHLVPPSVVDYIAERKLYH
ncbi:MAG TPA: nicotinate-nucleotide adenylyltransferase [Lacipirellulaceae bacterium]|nr:nicotinate-nucleotide adenylyltransferase [Lacipirellulaceae bacterium]